MSLQFLVALVTLAQASAFAPTAFSRFGGVHSRPSSRTPEEHKLCMKLGVDEKVIVIGVAADSGCGKSTFMRRLTKVFGGKNVGPLGGGFGAPGGWETNTLVSDVTTVICLDDYHLNDRNGRKVSGLTALNVKEQKFELMYEQIKALKEGKAISKPIYNHVNGTIDTPETVQPTPIVIIEGLHPLIDPKVHAGLRGRGRRPLSSPWPWLLIFPSLFFPRRPTAPPGPLPARLHDLPGHLRRD